MHRRVRWFVVVWLTQIGKHATEDTAGHTAVPAFKETARDFKSFGRRAGALPMQQVKYFVGSSGEFKLTAVPRDRIISSYKSCTATAVFTI